jgi:hypothetical protein
MFVKEKGKATNKEYQRINNCSRNTATNDLRALIDLHILKESGKKGAGSFYAIAHIAQRSHIDCTIRKDCEQLWISNRRNEDKLMFKALSFIYRVMMSRYRQFLKRSGSL